MRCTCPQAQWYGMHVWPVVQEQALRLPVSALDCTSTPATASVDSKLCTPAAVCGNAVAPIACLAAQETFTHDPGWRTYMLAHSFCTVAAYLRPQWAQ
jgi:hypothetical protein